MTLPDIPGAIDVRQLWILGIASGVLALGWAISSLLHVGSLTSEKLHRELMLRVRTWAIIIPVTAIPILIGPVGIATAVVVLGMVCFREFSRATKLSGGWNLSVPVALGLLMVATAILRHDHRLLLLSAPLVAIATAATSLLRDQPDGYLKRIALGNLGFMLCCLWPGHIGFLGSDLVNGTVVLWFILCIELNDVFAFVSGKVFGRVQLCPNTSPGKTRGGLIGSIVMTTGFATASGMFLFPDQLLGHPALLIPVGALLSLSGSIGDLILSSIKRDLHLKDLSQALPGHGGMLDRCDSLIFAAPVVALTLGSIDSLQNLTSSLP